MAFVITCFLVFCIAYAIGRLGHIYGGHFNGPRHWMFGAILFLPGLFFSNIYIFLLFSFAAGLMVSDLMDFLNLKIWGVDDVEVKKFWEID